MQLIFNQPYCTLCRRFIGVNPERASLATVSKKTETSTENSSNCKFSCGHPDKKPLGLWVGIYSKGIHSHVFCNSVLKQDVYMMSQHCVQQHIFMWCHSIVFCDKMLWDVTSLWAATKCCGCHSIVYCKQTFMWSHNIVFCDRVWQ